MQNQIQNIIFETEEINREGSRMVHLSVDGPWVLVWSKDWTLGFPHSSPVLLERANVLTCPTRVFFYFQLIRIRVNTNLSGFCCINFIFFVVGGPLKFPELSESFIETEQNLTEVLLQELQKELRKCLKGQASQSRIERRMCCLKSSSWERLKVRAYSHFSLYKKGHVGLW